MKLRLHPLCDHIAWVGAKVSRRHVAHRVSGVLVNDQAFRALQGGDHLLGVFQGGQLILLSSQTQIGLLDFARDALPSHGFSKFI